MSKVKCLPRRQAGQKSNVKQKGQALVFAVIIAGFLTLLSAAALSFSSSELFFSKRSEQRLQTLALAEGGIDKAIFELNQDQNYTGEQATALGEGEFTVIVSGTGQTRQIESEGAIPGFQNFKQKRKIRVTATISTTNIAFHYGVQVGDGGMVMNNNSGILGSVYSDGNIQGGTQGSAIDGDAFVAGGTAASTDSEWITQNADFIFGQQTPQTDPSQSFVPQTSNALSKVTLYIKKVGSPGNKTVRILSDDNSQPSKNSLASGTLNASLVTTNYGWIDVSLSSPPNLTAGTTYWLTIDSSNNLNNYYVWGLDNTNGYSLGTGKYSPDWNAKTPSWADAGGDFNFKVWMGGINTFMDQLTIGGSAYANTISDSTVGGNVHCRTLDHSTVGGNAYCDTISSSQIGGQTFPGEPDPAHLDLPISDANIEQWKDDADDGQIINSDYSPSQTSSLGPAKINGSLFLDNNQTLTLTGTVWVTGNITVDQNSKIVLDPGFGANSGVIISDGWQHLANNGIFQGSGQAGSYILMLSTATGGGPDDSAIDIVNGVDSTIFYAGAGMINIHQNVNIKEVTAYQIRLEENAQITYESGLQNAKFTSGPGGGWSVDAQSWQEIRQ